MLLGQVLHSTNCQECMGYNLQWAVMYTEDIYCWLMLIWRRWLLISWCLSLPKLWGPAQIVAECLFIANHPTNYTFLTLTPFKKALNKGWPILIRQIDISGSWDHNWSGGEQWQEIAVFIARGCSCENYCAMVQLDIELDENILILAVTHI